MKKAGLLEVVWLTKGRRAGGVESGGQVFQFLLTWLSSSPTRIISKLERLLQANGAWTLEVLIFSKKWEHRTNTAVSGELTTVIGRGIHYTVTSLSQLLGLLVSYFQIGSITGAILIVLIAVVGGILYQSAWIIAPKLWIIGTLFPLAGYSLGFLLARVSGQPWHRYGVLVNQTGNFLL